MAASKAESQVAAFYANCNVFITGSSGFLGKVLVEKLLRSCPDVAGLYLLIRNKKGVDIQKRLEKLTESTAFDVLRIQQPNFAEKLHPILGDMQYEDLALLSEDREFLIKNIDIVFHVAATIRFDEEIKKSVNINVRGTREILNLCEQMQHLKAVIHTSTAYSHCTRKQIDETFYPAPCRPDTIIKFVNEIDNDTLNKISPSLLTQGQHTWPNNYTFTKAIAEELIRERQDRLPVGIVRPATVSSTYNEPVKGWCDNMYGIIGFQAGCLTLVNVAMYNRNIKCNLIPADYVMNAHIIAAERVAREYKNNVESKKIIYNSVISYDKCPPIGEYIMNTIPGLPDYPMHAFPYPYFVVETRCKYYYTFLSIFLHYIPASIFDLYAVAKGKKAKYIKYYKMIGKFSKVLAHFMYNEWYMTNDNLHKVFDDLNETDKALFPCDMDTIDFVSWLTSLPYGIKKYLLKEAMDEKSVQADREAFKRNTHIYRIIVTGFYVLVAFFCTIYIL